MEFYCLSGFKTEFDKLCKNNSYKDLPKNLIDCFFEKEIDEIRTGRLLNQSHEFPYIKKRLSGRGGFRLYLHINIIKENVYLMFVHPKSGSMGSENLKPEFQAQLYRDVLDAIKANDLFKLTITRDEIFFSRLEKKSKSWL